jgi:hypothetical protein
MRYIEIANRHYRARAEANPNVALMFVYPEERIALSDLMSEHGGLEIVHQEESPVDEAALMRQAAAHQASARR